MGDVSELLRKTVHKRYLNHAESDVKLNKGSIAMLSSTGLFQTKMEVPSSSGQMDHFFDSAVDF